MDKVYFDWQFTSSYNHHIILFFHAGLLKSNSFCLDVAAHISENWTVQRQKNYPFSSIACDQTIEQTLNRYSLIKICIQRQIIF